MELSTLTPTQRMVIEVLAGSELRETPERYLPCPQATLHVLLWEGWLDHRPARVISHRYDDNEYVEAVYWLTNGAWDALVQSEW